MKLNRKKCKGLHLWKNNFMHECWLGADLLVRRSGVQDAPHEPGVCPCDQEGQWCPGIHLEDHFQQTMGADPAPLLCSGEATSGVLCPVLCSTVQERHEGPGVGPVEDYKDD
ncbi:hypothetical protein DUI87_06010 [Hirundo rustica rustica]|uniref:Uncharacterized protein n=1 Tax=Hirundo rustica rustica TaxID=333673 RepID=A0A3M0KW24_HIRRU|nr:hypothetical protein DUI87_06010 [Hirundo rustica rustica]